MTPSLQTPELQPGTILFDGGCPLCRQLAYWMDKSQGDVSGPATLHFSPWAKVAELFPTQAEGPLLRFWTGEELLVGSTAWQEILRRAPFFRSLSWVAQRLGLETQLVATAQTGGTMLRRLCPRCGAKTRR